MKKIISFVLLTVVCLAGYSQDVTAANNFIQMSYATMSVYQTVTLSATEKAGGTFTATIQAKDGGGRGPPNYSADIINLRIDYYNSTGTLLGYSLSSNSTNYYATTYSTYTLTSANCGSAGSCANVATAKVSFIGNDGGYWAGNVGTRMEAPTLTFTPTGGVESSNLLYNPQWATSAAYTSTSGPAGWYNSTTTWGGNTHPQLYDAGASLGVTITGGSISQTNAPATQVITSGGSSTAGITSSQQTRVDTWTNASQTGNYIYIEQISGNNNTVAVTQSGDKNKITATLDGAGTNTVNLTQTGNSNYMKVDVNGYGNSLTGSQTNTNTSHYAETSITGNSNTVNHSQSGNTNNMMFTTISGNNNTVTATQSGTGNHYLDTKLTGNGNTALVDQSGSTQNKATIDLTNAGGPATVDLQQTGGKNFSIIQSCVNAAGCTTTVRQ